MPEDQPEIDYNRIWQMIRQHPHIAEPAIREKLEKEFTPELLRKYGYELSAEEFWRMRRRFGATGE
jgi:hypothetical protein